MKWNTHYTTSAIWASTVPMWGMSAAFNAASGNGSLAAFNVCLMALNTILALNYATLGKAQNLRESAAQERNVAQAEPQADETPEAHQAEELPERPPRDFNGPEDRPSP